ncbi:MAG: DUF72 domain-containing protein [Acidimicrobiales bacterium]
MRAADRLAYYAGRLPLAEIGTTRWFPPTPEQAQQWATRTPASFRFDVQAWSLFTGASTLPSSLWPDLFDEVRPEARERHRLYREHLSIEGRSECWARFRHALEPLDRTGRLGCVTLRCPQWLRPGRTAAGLLTEARAALDGWAIAVELPNHRWHEGGQAEETIALLEDLDLALTCVDAAPRPDRSEPLVAATADLAVVRFLGRRPGRWSWPWRYDEAALAGWLPTLERLAEGCREVHCLFANTHADDAVNGALALRSLVDPQPVQGVLF